MEIAKIQSTEASNKIEGIVTTRTRMKQLFEEKTTPRNRDEDEIMGYRDVLNTIHESHDYIPVRPSYILQLHKDLLAKAGLSYGGHLKNVQNYISKTRADGTMVTRFTPVEPFCTPDAVENLCHAYEQAISGERIDALILIPSFIIDFLCIHPFNDGNGRMSRLLTTLLLYRSDYEIGRYISLEAKIADTKSDYYDALEASQTGWHEGNDDPTPFIKYLLGTILAAYKDFEDRFSIIEEKLPAVEIVRKATLTKIGKFTKQDIIELCPSLSLSSVEGSLRKLVQSGDIKREGVGKGTFYYRVK